MHAGRRLPPVLAGLSAVSIGLLTRLTASLWLGRAARDDLRYEASKVATQQVRLFASDLAQFRLLPLVLGEYTDLSEALRQGDPAARRRIDGKLNLLAERTRAPVIYLIDRSGMTVSASNARTAESFVERNYRFRPYFVRAMRDGAAEYHAVGNVSGRPGLFLSRRIGPANDPAGVIVVKVEFDKLVRIWRTDAGQTLALDARGIILFSTDAAERFRKTRPLTLPEQAAIAGAAQFGQMPLRPSRYLIGAGDRAAMPAALPDAPRFVALFAGLVTLADWLGSDTWRLPVGAPHGPAREPLRVEQVRAAAAARGFLPLDTPACDFEQAFGFPPHGFQLEAAGDEFGAVALIEAETGSGKTEAALWRWLELRRRGQVDGLFFALPTRSAAVQLHARVDAMLKRVWGKDAPEAVLAVPGYLRAGDAVGQALPDYAVRWDEPGHNERDRAPDARWAAERSLNFLAARVAVGTIDQALLGILPVKHALFRAGVLSRSLLVVDEVHASDSYMAGLLERLLAHHVAVGGRALLLSATLGAAARAGLLGGAVPPLAEAEAQAYPALSGSGAALRAAAGAAGAAKRVAVEVAGLIDDAQAIAARAIEAAQAGASVLVVRNSVAGAVAVAQAVAARAPELAFAVEGVPTLHHGRFARDDRERLDGAVEQAFGKRRRARGQVLVGTQTLEQSLDLDADLLITDLAPIDVLLQRIGRLHRHRREDRGAFAQAHVLVLRPAARDLSVLLSKGSGARHGLGSVYPNLVQLEATLRVLERSREIVIPRDNRRLVERALHPEALAAIVAGEPAWHNHAAERAGGELASAEAARRIALDLSQPFRTLTFADVEEAVVTRLGARDLLIDLPDPIASPFGGAVTRVAIPAHMARGIGREEARVTGASQFEIGERRFGYDQWGLHALG